MVITIIIIFIIIITSSTPSSASQFRRIGKGESTHLFSGGSDELLLSTDECEPDQRDLEIHTTSEIKYYIPQIMDRSYCMSSPASLSVCLSLSLDPD